DAEIQALKEQLLSWDLYRGLFVSDDFTSTQIVVSHDLQLENDEREYLYLEIKEILADYESPVVKFYVAGEPVITLIISRDTRRDVSLLVPLVVLVVIAVLYFFFRRAGGVVLPLITAVVSIVWTLGLMVLLDIALTLISTVIPVLLVAVGSAYGIHLINHYYHDLAEVNNSDDANGASVMSRDAHRDLVVGVILQIGKPVLLAGLTTVVGFGALVTSSVEPMRTFGIFTAVGVFVAVIAALLLIPALLLMRHGVHPANSRERVRTRLQEQRRMFLEGLLDFFTGSKPRILVLTVLIAVAAAFGAARVVVDNELVEYFKEDTDIRRSDQFLRDKFAGTRTFSIVVSGQEKGDLTNPEALLAMDELAKRLRQHPDVGSVVSYTDFIKRMNQVMNVDAVLPGTERYDEKPTSAAGGFELGGFGS
ncbi:MAG: MMPL family transporter, partial [Spirochaetaceae bacterium]|nr:MMPL family transporter [Spirochaetaceae bacterium]